MEKYGKMGLVSTLAGAGMIAFCITSGNLQKGFDSVIESNREAEQYTYNKATGKTPSKSTKQVEIKYEDSAFKRDLFIGAGGLALLVLGGLFLIAEYVPTGRYESTRRKKENEENNEPNWKKINRKQDLHGY
jgi:hypothetical protein